MEVRDRLYAIVSRLYPLLHTFSEADRNAAAGYVIRLLIFLPLSLIGLVWLVGQTEVGELREHWLFLVAVLGLMVLLSQLWVQVFYITASGGYRSDRRSFWGEALWSAVLVIGPSAVWLGVLLPWISFLLTGLKGTALHRLRIVSQSVLRTSIVLLTLIEAWLYRQLGGKFPLSGLSLPDVLPAIAATLLGFSIGWIIISGASNLIRLMSPPLPNQRGTSALPRYSALVALAGPLVGLVAILPAGLYSLAGIGAFFSLWAIGLAAAFAADRLSAAIEVAQRRTYELEQLERLGREIVRSPYEVDHLPDLLQAHVPAMFPACEIAIRLESGEMLLSHPLGSDGPPPAMWRWHSDAQEPCILANGAIRPWSGEPSPGGMLLAPIITTESQRPLGRIYLHSQDHTNTMERLTPAAQSLAQQIASALISARVYQQHVAERVARERADRELALGARIQASFLPSEPPHLERWQLGAALVSARETSGDFYDYFPLGGGRFGIAIADVADKGLGAAFYMALSLTLLRTYAVDLSLRYPKTYLQHLRDVLAAVNERLLFDAGGETFVTLFYGVVDTKQATLRYVNAGHNPPFLFRRDRRRRPRPLRNTGLPVGVLEDTQWGQRTVRMEEGDVLVLYTDGLTEAENAARQMFGEKRLKQVIRANLQEPAQQLCDIVLESVTDFVGDFPRSDDITLVVLRRGS